MKVPNIRTWIAGIPERSAGKERIAPVDPNSGEPLSPVRESSAAQLQQAIEVSSMAYVDERWSGLSIDEKASVLESFAQGLDVRADEIARLDALNSGVPISTTSLFAVDNGATVRGAIEHARTANQKELLDTSHAEVRVHRVPWGPAALITPWNAPSAMVVKKFAYALAAGAPAIIKPSSAAPYSAELVAEAAVEAGFPAGSWSLVRGGANIGQALSGDARIAAISMTGSTAAGRDIAQRSAPHFTRLQLELGANNPAIVRADADIEVTATAIINGAWKLSGQWCEAPRRVYVHHSVYKELLEALNTASSHWKIGSSLDPQTHLGPVAFAARRDELLRQRAELIADGARLISEGDVPENGFFVSPSILEANGAEPAEEIFGPVLVVQSVRSDAAAMESASRGAVGLAAYVFTSDLDEGRRLGKRMPAGEVKINGTSILDMAPGSRQSFFGSSGIGGHGDSRLLEFFTGARILGEDQPGLPL